MQRFCPCRLRVTVPPCLSVASADLRCGGTSSANMRPLERCEIAGSRQRRRAADRSGSRPERLGGAAGGPSGFHHRNPQSPVAGRRRGAANHRRRRQDASELAGAQRHEGGPEVCRAHSGGLVAADGRARERTSHLELRRRPLGARARGRIARRSLDRDERTRSRSVRPQDRDVARQREIMVGAGKPSP